MCTGNGTGTRKVSDRRTHTVTHIHRHTPIHTYPAYVCNFMFMSVRVGSLSICVYVCVCVCVCVCPRRYPHKELYALWTEVLLYQFHDVLPGVL